MVKRQPDKLYSLKKVACEAAGHDSGDRYEEPKCHPETRAAILGDILSWVNSTNPKERVMWLRGPAEVGKSVIAQTVAYRCQNEKKLLASFFFSRIATVEGRDDGNRLIPTIAHQIMRVVPETKHFIIDRVQRNSILVSESMEVQMRELILEALTYVHNLIPVPDGVDAHIPELVIINGLHDCKDSQMQRHIITVISDALKKDPDHLRFLISSRPEFAIQDTFQSDNLCGMYTEITMDNMLFDANDDIKRYYLSAFATLKREKQLDANTPTGSNWPSPEDIDILVKRASGAFIYATTVIKYLQLCDTNLRESLRSLVMATGDDSKMSPRGYDHPQHYLDKLYHYILTIASTSAGSYDIISPLFKIMLYGATEASVVQISTLMSMEKQLFIPHLRCFINVVGDKIEFRHRSFSTFLTDARRASHFYIGEEEAHRVIGQYCFHWLCKKSMIGSSIDDMVTSYARKFYFEHMKKSNFQNKLLSEIRIHHTESTMRDIFSTKTRDIESVHAILVHMSRFDFLAELLHLEFPDIEDIEAISAKMAENVDREIMNVWDDNAKHGRNLPYLDVISAMIKTRQFPRLDTSIYQCWLASVLENPIRGQAYYLNSKESERIFRILWSSFSEIYTTESNQQSLMEELLRSSALAYLLKRIEPNIRFRKYLQDIYPAFMNHLGRISRSYKSLNVLTRKEWEDSVQDVRETIIDCLEEFHQLPEDDYISIAESDGSCSLDDTFPIELIYQVTAKKYIEDGRGNSGEKQRMLDQLLDESDDQSPYEVLDKLYLHILTEAVKHIYGGYNPIRMIFEVIVYTEPNIMLSPSALSSFLGCDESRLFLLLVDLHSIMKIPSGDYTNDSFISFSHISLIDFLKDPSRSNEFSLNEINAHVNLGCCCLHRIILPSRDYEVDRYVHGFLFYHLKKSRFNDTLMDALRSYNEKFVIRQIISKIGGELEAVRHISVHVFAFDFFTQGSKRCAVPIVPKIRSVYDAVYIQIENALKRNFDPFEKICFLSILAISEVRREPDHRPSLDILHYCWQATLLENKDKGNCLYLDEKMCQFMFRKLWEQKQNSELSFDEEALLPVALHYLLKRIKTSKNFAYYLKEILPALRYFLDSISENYELKPTIRSNVRVPFRPLSKGDGHRIISNFLECLNLYLEKEAKRRKWRELFLKVLGIHQR